jgi:hypothetical protein
MKEGPLQVGLDPSLGPWASEVKYALRTLLRVAGFPYDFDWAHPRDTVQCWDIYYGPRRDDVRAEVSIMACGRSYGDAAWMGLRRVHEAHGLPWLEFGDQEPTVFRTAEGRHTFVNDVVFGAYWLLVGAREPRYPRGAHDIVSLHGEPLWEQGLLSRPPVSLYAAFLRRAFEERGRVPLPRPWESPRGGGTFVFSHDVDYPQMIRWIECLRLARQHGPRSLGPIARVLSGTSHFWTFGDWLAFEARLGARSAFYFMSQRGSPLKYALGTPDAFYDIRRPEFREVFRRLLDAGCEIGLHASYHAYRSIERIERERARLETAAGVTVQGNRHHYFHLDPLDPQETLRRHEQAGLVYDSSLVFDGYPGFRRGICHPFRPYHPAERRELQLVELPPAVMDDHFDRRLAMNRIEAPADHFSQLLDVARTTGGVVVVDYHVRGMNADFYPRYGPWLRAFADRRFDDSMAFPTPGDVVRGYIEYERAIDAGSSDRTLVPAASTAPRERVTFGPLRPGELRALADLHVEFFGSEARHGTSAGTLGAGFLEQFFYGLNLDNPYLFVDVARFQGRVVGFSACASDWTEVSRWLVRYRFRAACAALIGFACRRPLAVARYILGNLQFTGQGGPSFSRDVPGMFMLIGVRPECRSRAFKEQTGISLADELFERVERTLSTQGCREFWVILGAENAPVNRLFLKHGAVLVGQGWAQSVWSNYYRKSLVATGTTRLGEPVAGPS